VVLLLGVTFWIVPSSLGVTEHALAADVPGLKGFTIAVIADPHAGSPFIDERKLDEIVTRTNAANPDLVLLTGDFAGGMAPETMAARLSRLQARMGVYAVLGDGDLPQGDDAATVAPALERNGLFVLRGSYIVLGTAKGPVILTGLNEGNGGLSRIPPTGAVLCLAATAPDWANLPARCALTVAGPRHGDQYALPRPAPIRRDGGRTLFVSPGIGTIGLPVRLAPPEISLLKIQ
jgi:predicted MPP superfamily phosphohydrolase